MVGNTGRMTFAEKREYLALLESKLERQAKRELNTFCRSIEIPGVPVRDTADCEEFYPDTVDPAAHHQLINRILQAVAEGTPIDGRVPKRVMFFMPPGSAKSTYATVVFPPWYMGRYPMRNVICTSYNSTLATKFGRKTRSIAKSEKFKSIMGCGLVEDNRAADDWSLTNGSTYMAGGILSGITGNRSDLLVIDDPVKGREDADSVTIREKTWDEYKSSLLTRLKPNGAVVIIQTRWHEDDLSGRILPKDYDGQSGWIESRDGDWWYVVSLQAECDTDTDPLGRVRGEWLWPEWFTPAFWQQTRRTQGSRNWDALYQQKPKPVEGGIFKRHWFASNRYIVPPAIPLLIVQSWDTASKEAEHNDPSACTTWAVTHQGWYLLHCLADRLLYPDLKRTVKSMAAQWRPDVILIEDKSSGQNLISDLRSEAGLALPIVAIEPEGNKETRAHAVSALAEAGLVFLPEDAPWLTMFDAEFFAFPLSTHDDIVDSSTQFLRWIHVRNIQLQAFGSGKTISQSVDQHEERQDYDAGYGVVRGGSNLSGW